MSKVSNSYSVPDAIKHYKSVLSISSLVIRVGFEQNITKALETDGSVEVCIQVFNVPDNNLLSFPFDLDLFTIPGTAGIIK